MYVRETRTISPDLDDIQDVFRFSSLGAEVLIETEVANHISGDVGDLEDVFRSGCHKHRRTRGPEDLDDLDVVETRRGMVRHLSSAGVFLLVTCTSDLTTVDQWVYDSCVTQQPPPEGT